MSSSIRLVCAWIVGCCALSLCSEAHAQDKDLKAYWGKKRHIRVGVLPGTDDSGRLELSATVNAPGTDQAPLFGIEARHYLTRALGLGVHCAHIADPGPSKTSLRSMADVHVLHRLIDGKMVFLGTNVLLRFELYGALGLGQIWHSVEDAEMTTFGPSVGVGLRFKLGGDFMMHAEWRHHPALYLRDEPEVSASFVDIGISYRFGDVNRSRD